jgi:translation initiation factor IF-2
VVVLEGKLQRGAMVVVRRGRKTILYEGPLTSLRRVKENVGEVRCGHD